MNIEKAYWSSNGESISIAVPFTKVDTARRTVSGFATLDNVDKQADIVTAACAEEAFTAFRGNLREMHQPIAVGKVLSFSQEPFYDPEADTIYNGTYVTAYVSEGAQDTWVKVLDGTLTGFSIGGKIVDAEPVFDSKINKSVRVVNKMELFELSLVDNPANPLANILTLSKGADGELIAKGIAVGVSTENIMWCESCKIAKATADETAACINCGAEMFNIGWFESNSNVAEKMRIMVGEYLSKLDSSGSEVPGDEGGVDMSEEITKNDEVVDEAAVVDEVVADEVVIEDVEKTEEVETPEPELDLAKAFEDIKSFVAEAISGVKEEISKSASESIVAGIEEIKASIEAYKAVVTDDLKTFREELNNIGQATEGVAKRLGDVEDLTATKKSGDLGGDPEVKKSVWSGTDLGVDTLI